MKIRIKENKRGDLYETGKQKSRELKLKRVRELDSL